MLISLVGLVLAIQAAKTVDLDVTGLRADYAVAALGKAAGVELRARAALQDSTVVLRLHGVTLEDAKARLAKALGATWLKDGEVDVLDRPGLTPQQKAQMRGRFRTAAVQTFLTKYPLVPSIDTPSIKELLRQARDATAGAEAMNRATETIEKNAPEYRMKVLACKAVGAEAIGQVPPGGREVFSINPTSKQRLLPAIVGRYVDDWIKEENVYADALKDDDRFRWRTYRISEGVTPKAADLRALYLIVESGINTITIWINCYTADGTSPFSAESSLSISVQNPEEHPGKAAKFAAEGQFKPSERAKFATNLARGWVLDQNYDRNVLLNSIPDFADEQRADTFLAPVAEALDTWAKAKDMNMVAVLPEYQIGEPSQTNGNWKAADCLSTWASAGRAKIENADGWITITPTDPLGERAIRRPRKPFFALIQQALKNYKLTLDDLAEAATQLDDGEFFDTCGTVDRMLGISSYTTNGLRDARALRLYGLLGKADRAKVLAGQQVVIPLGGSIYNELDRIVYHTRFRVTPPDYQHVAFGKEDSLDWISGSSWAGGQKSEPTSDYGGGLPGATKLTFQLIPITAVASKSSDPNGWPEPNYMFLNDFLRQNSGPQTASLDKNNLAAVVQMTRLGVKVDFGDGGWGSVNMVWPDDMRPPQYGTPSAIIAANPPAKGGGG